jgi:hypothetical protein
MKTYMNLQIETKNEARKGDVENAYNIAINHSTINDFMKSLQLNIGASKVGRGGNHIWIMDTITNERLAIINNLFEC